MIGKKCDFKDFSIYLLEFIERHILYKNYASMKKSLTKDDMERYSFKDFTEKIMEMLKKDFIGFWMETSKEDIKHFDNPQSLIDFFKESFDLDVDFAFFKIINSFTQNLTYEKFCETENALYLIQLFSEFDNYFFKCLKYILLKQPSLLYDQTITIKELLENKGDFEEILDMLAEKQASKKFDVDLLLDDIIERKVHNKFYKGYWEICVYAIKKLGLPMDLEKDSLMFMDVRDVINRIEEYKQVRNLYAHGDGKINRIFLSKVKKLDFSIKKYELGKKYLVTDDKIKDVIFWMQLFIVYFDRALLKSHPELLYKN